MTMAAILRSALLLLLVSTLGLGLAYPLAMTGLGRLLFRERAAGSPLLVAGEATGSRLVGQEFQGPGWFWGRPSAAAGGPYDATMSGGSNLGPLNAQLRALASARAAALRQADPDNDRPVPCDLVTASGSGLDPHISPEAALYQVQRVARERGLAPQALDALVRRHVETGPLDLFGRPRVNVLILNLDLIRMAAGDGLDAPR